MKNFESMAKPFFLYCLFRDFDEFADTIQAWELDFLQLERGKLQAEVIQTGIDTSVVSHARFNRLIHQRGSPPGGFRTFAVLTDPSFRLLWRNQQITGDMIMAFPPGGEFDAVSRAGFDVFTLSFSEEVLLETGHVLGIPTIQDLLGKTEVFTCHAEEMLALRNVLHGFRLAMTHSSLQKGNYWLQGQLKGEIPTKLVSALSTALSCSDGITFRLRDRALNRALACIEESADTPLTVQALCRLSGASERTLQYAFLERFGVSPKTYLQSLRFNRVRTDLRSADPRSVRVVDVANHWGFWHMGQFAADYRRLFGELPSKTLGK